MCAFFRWTMLGIFLAVPVVAQDKPAEKKPGDKEVPKATPKAETKNPEAKPTGNKYQLVSKISGKLEKVNSKDMTLTIELQIKQGRSYKAHHEEINLADDVKIRAMLLPEQFDEKNRPKPYTPAEKAKLKGDNPKLPGYTADMGRLASGQVIEIELSTIKPPPGTPKWKDKDVLPEKPIATMVVIVAEEAKAANKKK